MNRRPDEHSSASSDRAVSELLGFVFVFSLIVVSVAIISISGLDSLQSTRDAEQLTNAERAFDVLDDNIQDIYRERAPSRETEFDVNDARVTFGDHVTMNLTGVDSATGDRFIIERAITPIVYEANGRDTRLIYVAGAVLRVENQGGVVLNEPPVVLRNGSTIVPIVNTTSPASRSSGGGTILIRALEQNTTVELAERNPTYDHLWLNITTTHRDTWFNWLDDRPAVECRKPATDEVACKFRASPDRLYVTVVDIRLDIEE